MPSSAPAAPGITYTATTARMLFGMQRNGTLPNILGHIHPGSGVPRPAMWFNLLVEFLYLFLLPRLGHPGGRDLGGDRRRLRDSPHQCAGPAHDSRRRAAPLPGTVSQDRRCRSPSCSQPNCLYWARWPLTGESHSADRGSRCRSMPGTRSAADSRISGRHLRGALSG